MKGFDKKFLSTQLSLEMQKQIKGGTDNNINNINEQSQIVIEDIIQNVVEDIIQN